MMQENFTKQIIPKLTVLNQYLSLLIIKTKPQYKKFRWTKQRNSIQTGEKRLYKIPWSMDRQYELKKRYYPKD